MKNKRIICVVLAAMISISVLSGCKPSVPQDENITSKKSEITNTEKEEKTEGEIEENPVNVEATGKFLDPIGTNGDNDNMNSPLDVSISVLYGGAGGHFYDSEAIYGYLKNKDTLIFDSPMFDLAYNYTLNREKGEISAIDTINMVSTAEDFFVSAENVEMVLKNYEELDKAAIAKRVYSSDASRYLKEYVDMDAGDLYAIKNEETVFSGIYKAIANYYNAKFFGTNFSSGSTEFEGDPELVYTYTKQNGGIVTSMLNTQDEQGFELDVDMYCGAIIAAKTKYKMIGSKNGLYQEYNKTDTFFLIPVYENNNLTFKIDFVFSPTDYIYSYTDNPRYDENMKLIPKEVVSSEDGSVLFADN